VTTARAVAITGIGPPEEVVTVIERDIPEPGAGEVRIAVRAAPVHPSDSVPRQRGFQGLPPPWVAGWDCAGVVESVGSGVDGLAVGDEVMAIVVPWRPEGGAQTELLVAPAGSVVPIPDGATLEQASTLPMNALTAISGLEPLGLTEGRTLAVTGGAGLLASYVIGMAKQRGLRVLADASPEDEELVRSFGADVVLPRGERLVDAMLEAVPGGVDAVYDTALLTRSIFPGIREGGSIVPVRGWDGDDVEDGIHVHPVYVWTVVGRTDWLEEARALASGGVLALRVAGTYPPERAADAQRRMDAGGLRGRVLITFSA
jgi:NADPH:quinone reductase-like Zn-dependent oxidoreductase